MASNLYTMAVKPLEGLIRGPIRTKSDFAVFGRIPVSSVQYAAHRHDSVQIFGLAA